MGGGPRPARKRHSSKVFRRIAPGESRHAIMVDRVDELSSPAVPTTFPPPTTCFACGTPLDPALAGLADGALFASRFEILGPLGRGGMGMVYRAFDRELGETVAIKVLRPDVARESFRNEQRFRSEIRLARRVRHRNVCSVYGDGRRPGAPLHLHGAHRGREPRAVRPRGERASPGGGLERHPAGRRRPARDPRGGRRAPRPQDREPHARPRRDREGDGLRDRQAARPGGGRGHRSPPRAPSWARRST